MLQHFVIDLPPLVHTMTCTCVEMLKDMELKDKKNNLTWRYKIKSLNSKQKFSFTLSTLTCFSIMINYITQDKSILCMPLSNIHLVIQMSGYALTLFNSPSS